jgi:hypothetical protein
MLTAIGWLNGKVRHMADFDERRFSLDPSLGFPFNRIIRVPLRKIFQSPAVESE